jgi:hypothetical protein
MDPTTPGMLACFAASIVSIGICILVWGRNPPRSRKALASILALVGLCLFIGAVLILLDGLKYIT